MATPSWCATKEYIPGECAVYGNFVWVAVVANIANPPQSTTGGSSPFWRVLTTEGETATVALTDFSTGEQVLVTL